MQYRVRALQSKLFIEISFIQFQNVFFCICLKISQISKADGSHLAFTIQTFPSKINFSLSH